jgi:hypothetical protein
LVGFAAATRRPGFTAFFAGLTAFFVAAFAMSSESFIKNALAVQSDI